jgi:hypothetical protein
MDQFPGNSHTSRLVEKEQGPAKSETASDPKKVEKVVTGKVTVRNKPLGTRLKDMFINDGGSFGEYLVEKVVVPMVKDMVLSIITQTADGIRGGIEEKLFGPDEQSRRTRTPGYGTTRPVNYTRFSNPPSVGRRDSATRPASGHRAIRRSNVVKELIVETREEGDLVLEELDAIIDTVGHCTVGDYYSTMGENTRSTDEEWGWTSLAAARVSKLSTDEFLISMPRPLPIENG